MKRGTPFKAYFDISMRVHDYARALKQVASAAHERLQSIEATHKNRKR